MTEDKSADTRTQILNQRDQTAITHMAVAQKKTPDQTTMKPSKRLDDIASSISPDGFRTPTLITPENCPSHNRNALDAVRDYFSRYADILPRHFGVIHGIGRYIAGIGPIRLPNLTLDVPEHEPFLYLCPLSPAA